MSSAMLITDLTQYGFIPGDNLGFCVRCETLRFGMDPTARRCRKCALEMYDNNDEPDQHKEQENQE